MNQSNAEQEMLEKIRSLSPERAAEVADFIDFLKHKESERRMAKAMSAASESSFKEIWDNPDDADYDRL